MNIHLLTTAMSAKIFTSHYAYWWFVARQLGHLRLESSSELSRTDLEGQRVDLWPGDWILDLKRWNVSNGTPSSTILLVVGSMSSTGGRERVTVLMEGW